MVLNFELLNRLNFEMTQDLSDDKKNNTIYYPLGSEGAYHGTPDHTLHRGIWNYCTGCGGFPPQLTAKRGHRRGNLLAACRRV